MLTPINTQFFVGRYHQHQGVVIHERSQIVIKSVIEFLSTFQKTFKIIQAEKGKHSLRFPLLDSVRESLTMKRLSNIAMMMYLSASLAVCPKRKRISSLRGSEEIAKIFCPENLFYS